MYVVIEIENHPDHFATGVYGPYPDWDSAYNAAMEMEDSPSNIIPGYGCHRSWFQVMELTGR